MAETEKAKTETQVVQTKDGEIKITQPKDGKKHQNITVLLGQPDDLVREQVGGFVNFLRERAVVGLAVGFIIGLQAQTLVKQLVDSFVTPLLNFWFGKDLADKQITLHNGTAPVPLTWGKFLYSFISFLFVVLFVYVVIKLFRLDKIDKPKKK